MPEPVNSPILDQPLLQLWVRGSNHILVEGPRLPYPQALHLFHQLEQPSLASLTNPRPVLPPTHRLITQAFRENIALVYLFPSAEAHSPSVAQLLDELRQKGVEEIVAPPLAGAPASSLS